MNGHPKQFYVFGRFRFDAQERLLRYDGRSVPLAPKAADTLLLLIENAGQLVEKDELIRQVWPDAHVEEGALNKNISVLRRTLSDRDGGEEYIETIPKRGYRFVASLDEVIDKDGASTHSSSVAPGAMPPAVIAQPPSPRLSRRGLLWLLLVLACVIAVGLGIMRVYSRHSEQPMYFSISLPSPVRDLALSPNGVLLAFIAPPPTQSGEVLWVQRIGTTEAHPLPGTEGASYPFWSPDSDYIAFFADGKLKKIKSDGGAVQVLCDAPIGRGGTWNRDGVIIFAPDSGIGLRRVSDAGGVATLVSGFHQQPVTTMSNRWPVFLPDGKHFLYTSVDFGSDLQEDSGGIYLGSLDSPQHRRLVAASANAHFIPPGYLLFFRNKTLMAQRFNSENLLLAGEPVAVANDVVYLSSVARALFSGSQNGTLVYQKSFDSISSQLVWYDRTGRQLRTVGPPARYANPRLSPNGQSVAVDIDDPQSFNTDIWIIGSNPSAPFRFTFDPGQDEAPLWSSDGKTILWLSDRGGKNNLHIKAADESGSDKSITALLPSQLSFASAPSDWSPDRRFVLYTDMHEGTVLHLWVLPMTGPSASHRLLDGNAADLEGQFSPDGRWIAYCSNPSGQWEIYVTPFPPTGLKYQISTNGGREPRWRRDGKELFFLSPDRRLMRVSVKAGSKFAFTAPKPLFMTQAHEPITAEEFFTYDVSADGQRFLINTNVEKNPPPPLDIILNWASRFSY
jgi:eukaryotic-like serine/threonine-protein kinase